MVQIVSDSYCSSADVYGGYFVKERLLCVMRLRVDGSVAEELDMCQGDSGGGLVCQAPDGAWQVVGIVVKEDHRCKAVGKPGIYTKLQPYYQKIIEMLRALSPE